MPAAGWIDEKLDGNAIAPKASGITVKAMRHIIAAMLLAITLAMETSAKEAIRLEGETYYLAFTESNEDGSLKEFLLQGETLETWTRMVAVRNFRKIKSPKHYIESMAQNYRAKYPHMQFAVFEKKETKAWAIDCIAYPLGQDSGHVEWNYFQAGRVKGTKGIVVNQYVERKPYEGSLEPVFKAWNLRDYRTKMLGILMPAEFEIVNLPERED